MFDWRAFLERHGIPYLEAGGKVQRGNIGITCPWCDDPSHIDHLGISLEGKGYHCWKGGKRHSGRAPQRLIVALIGCTQSEADRIVGSSSLSFARQDDTFAADALSRLGVKKERAYIYTAPQDELELLPEFRPIDGGRLDQLLVMPYLERRGYNQKQALKLAKRYNLHFAMRGRFSYRIIIPVYADRRLVAWTGRTIAQDEPLRYKSLTPDPEKAAKEGLPVARQNIKNLLFDQDELMSGGDTLVITEGPFDAMRVASFGEADGIRATALFGKEPRPDQLALLYDLSQHYKDVVAVFDRDADFDAFLLKMDYLRVKRLSLPRGVKDPGELRRDQFDRLFSLT